MLAGGQPIPQHADRLLELCQLERELALLQRRRRPLLQAAATSCRRLLVERPRSGRADEAYLLLAQIELELGHRRRVLELVRELGRRHPRSRRRCTALTIAASAARRRATAIALCRRGLALPSCKAAPRARRDLGYRLAWELIRGKQVTAGSAVLRRLLRESRGRGRWSRRLLEDLALVWSSHTPPADAVGVLFGRATAARATGLCLRVGRGLLRQRRLGALLRFTAAALRRLGKSRRRVALRRLRLVAVSRLAPVTTALREARRARRALPGAAAAALLATAERLARRQRGADEPGAPPLADAAAALRLVETVIREYPFTRAASRARLWQARRALAAGVGLGHAQRLLEAVRRRERRSALWRDATLALLACLERRAAAGTAKVRLSLARRFVTVARGFVDRHPGHAQAPAVLLALAERANEAGQPAQALTAARAFLGRHPRHAERFAVVEQALFAAGRLGQREMFGRLLVRHLRRAPRKVAARLRRAAARAALAGARRLMAAGAPAAARWWASAAARQRVGGAAERIAWQALALLAARAGDAPALGRAHRRLLPLTKGRQRVSLQRRHARWALANGALAAAARRFTAAARASRRTRERVELTLDAAAAWRWAGRPRRARRLLRPLRAQLGASGDRPRPWQARAILRLGRQLARIAPRRGYAYYLLRADQVWRRRPRLAARCLLRAARLAPTPRRRRGLLAQAQQLAGPLAPRGRASDLAIEVRLERSAAQRARLDVAAGELRRAERALRGLQQLNAELIGVLALRHPRWSSAAGVEIGRVLAAMARVLRGVRLPAGLSAGRRRALAAALERRAAGLGRRRVAVLDAVARLAGRADRLNRHTMAALRLRGRRRTALDLAATHLPPPGDWHAASLRRLVAAGAPRAALRAAEETVALHGARPGPLCLRGVARFRRGQLQRARRDFEAALAADPSAACARLNLATLALWRGAADRARRLLAGAVSPALASQLARASTVFQLARLLQRLRRGKMAAERTPRGRASGV